LIWKRNGNKRRITDSQTIIADELAKFDADATRWMVIWRARIVASIKAYEHDWKMRADDLKETPNHLYG
jgi:hypothetical protein